MNHQRGLYSNGYTVMYAAMPNVPRSASCVRDCGDQDAELFFDDERKWKRLPSPVDWEKYTSSSVRPTKAPACESPEMDAIATTKEEDHASKTTETKMRLSFTYHVQSACERVRFAFCYPYPYTKLSRQLDSFDRIHGSKMQASDVVDNSQEEATSACGLFYHRQVLTHSLGGLPIELVTISSRDHLVDSLPGAPTEFDVSKKRTVIISARVHPGETPASFMLDGMFSLLLHPTDPSALALRRSFVFKIIPMLNPDGVCQGYYRTDTRGVNLNRVYDNPDATQEPAIAATRDLLLDTVDRYRHAGRDKDEVVYLDLHAHSNHRGGFVYGNWLVPRDCDLRSPRVLTRQVETQLFAKLCSLNSPFFDYNACSFDAANMTRRDARSNNNSQADAGPTTREGCSRVALHHATGLTYIYTIECNYNEGRRRVEMSSSGKLIGASNQDSRRSMSTPERGSCAGRLQRHVASSGGRIFMKFSPLEWADVGIGALLSLLDLFALPGRTTAVASSPFRTLDGVKKSILVELQERAGVDVKTSASQGGTVAVSTKTNRGGGKSNQKGLKVQQTKQANPCVV
ncbi:hypothetical protein PINS_up010354 [Pythium insidiosum]|nr:hypothetical protein PINS_up010354 [Pythium insidiosum]